MRPLPTALPSIPSGEVGTEDVILVDVCPLTLSIGTTGGVFTKLIPRDAVVPLANLRCKFLDAAMFSPMLTILNVGSVHQSSELCC